MAVIDLSSFKKYLFEKEAHIIDNRNYSNINYDIGAPYELLPLFYVNEFDKRVEYMNKIAKLMNPFIQYGMWRENVTPTFNEWGDIVMAPFIPIIIDDSEPIMPSQTRIRILAPHKRYGIPRRIGLFEKW